VVAKGAGHIAENSIVLGSPFGETSQLVTVEPDNLLHHTLIVGQSGSGKSFLVARLLEEIILRTSARVVVLDPNGDFRAVHQHNETIWTDSNFDAALLRIASLCRDKGLVVYDGQEEFVKGWDSTYFSHLSLDPLEYGKISEQVDHARLGLDWRTLGEEQDFLLGLNGDLSPEVMLALMACRENLRYLMRERKEIARGINLKQDVRGLLHCTEVFLRKDINLRKYPYVKQLSSEAWMHAQAHLHKLLERHRELWTPSQNADLCTYIIAAFADEAAPRAAAPWDMLLLGLDSAKPHDARLVADVALWRLWKAAKQSRIELHREIWGGSSPEEAPVECANKPDDIRVPTFIVIDEAHIFAPASANDALTSRVTDRIISIASEGRKYGLYLILATQRPTKLHPNLVPECENQCVLRLQARLEHDFASNMLGLPPERVREVVRYRTGRVIMSGRWAGDERVLDMDVAPARILVGGQKLSEKWHEPRFSESRVRIPVQPDIESPDPVRRLSAEHKELRERIWNELLRVLAEECGSGTFVRTSARVNEAVCWEAKKTRWAGTGSFTAFVNTMNNGAVDIIDDDIENDRILLLRGEEQTARDRASLPDIAIAVCRETDVPRLTSEAYASVFRLIADEYARQDSFSLTALTRNVRDRAVAEGRQVGRIAANFIVKGLSYQGKDFGNARDSTPLELAEAFVQNVLLIASNTALEIDDEDRNDIERWICGCLLSDKDTEKSGLAESTEDTEYKGDSV
jgi:hypothetical protein